MKTVTLSSCCKWAEPDNYCFNAVEGRTEYCAHHNRLNRKQEQNERKAQEAKKLQLSKKSEPRAKPNKVSKKRQEQNKTYAQQREDFLRMSPNCEAKIERVCDGKTCDVHHQKGRANWDLLDMEYWLPVCRACHDWIHQHPLEALKRNLSFSRLEIKQTI